MAMTKAAVMPLSAVFIWARIYSYVVHDELLRFLLLRQPAGKILRKWSKINMACQVLR